MGNLTEQTTYEAAIYKIDKGDPVEGGDVTFEAGEPTAGWSNAQAQQLANRTNWLKAFADARGNFKASPDTYGDDVNNLKDTGLYYVQNAASNKPTTGNFITQVTAGGNDEVAQVAMRASTGRIYVRLFDGTSWGVWREQELYTISSPDANTTVKKYADGRIEQYGTLELTGVDVDSTAGNIFSGAINSGANFVSSDFDSVDSIIMQKTGAGSTFWVSTVSFLSGDYSLGAGLNSATSITGASISLHYHIKGTQA